MNTITASHIVTLGRREEHLTSQLTYLAGSIASAVADDCQGFTFDALVEQYKEARDELTSVRAQYSRILEEA